MTNMLHSRLLKSVVIFRHCFPHKKRRSVLLLSHQCFLPPNSHRARRPSCISASSSLMSNISNKRVCVFPSHYVICFLCLIPHWFRCVTVCLLPNNCSSGWQCAISNRSPQRGHTRFS